MADSLVIANAIELLGHQAVSANPRCAGAQFMLQPGFSLGAPQPTTDFVASLILDGERPYGQRSSNRTISLPIWIKAPNRYILAAAREVLEEAINQQTWTLAWTRDPGAGGTPLTLLLDCFRAQPSVPTYNTSAEKQGGVLGSQITIQFEALPFGRSDTQTQVAFAAPVPTAPPPPPAPVVLDNYSTISTPTFSQSTQCIVGPNSGCWDPDSFGDPGGQVSPLAYSAMFGTPLNLTGMTSVQGYVGLGSRYWWALEHSGKTRIRVDMTLTDTNGQTLSFSRSNLLIPVSPVYSVPVFSRVTLFIPQGSTTFLYGSVASYSLKITNRAYPADRFAWTTAYLDALTAYPASQTAAPVTRGNVYTLYGVVGTARAPASLSFQQAPTPGTPTTITTAGAGTYTVPAGTVYLKVEAIGGGGAGASQAVAGVGGGGGGGEDAQEPVFAAVPAQVIPYLVGAGGTSGATPVNGQPTVFGPGPSSSLAVVANGGQSAAQNSITAGPGGSGSGNLTHFPGGPGRTASGSVGGGGGSSAGSLLPGNTPTGTANVTLTGSGNWTVPLGVTQVTVTAIGAGGGAGTGGAGNGAGGGGGESAIETFTVTPGASIPYSCGAGGTPGATSGDLPGSAGGNTTFGPVSSVTLTAHGGSGGPSSTHSVSGGPGGTGSAAPVHFNGGQGGTNNPYTGGGGSSAGPASAGNAGNGYAGAGVAPSGGGAGGAGSGSRSGTGASGSLPGGGGGGTWSSGFTAGTGGAGQIVIAYPGGAPTNNGAAAPAGGGAGGAGGASANTAGTAGTAPGGGGGGADSTGTSEAGGAGAAGKLIITPYTNPAFKTLIVHRPPLGTPKTFQPLVSVGGGTGVPNGGTQYTMPQPITGVSADFSGTYTLYLVNASWNGSTSRTITVTVTQWDVTGGTSNAVSTTPITITPAQITNGIVTAGVLTLPQRRVAADNTGGFYTVSVTDTNTSDRFYDLIFLDTMGQTAVINEPTTGYSTYWIDEPDALTDLGLHLGSNSGRPNAISVMDACPSLSGGPITLEPADGDNQLFAYCLEGAPSIGLTYYARWFFDRLF